MKVNLKEIAQDKSTLEYVVSILANQQLSKPLSRKVSKIVKFMEDLERDLEMGGECVIELDKPRLEAIEERNRMSNFMQTGDDF